MSFGNLLLVPGLSGSELWTPPSVFGIGPELRVWLNYGLLAGGGWRWLALMPDGITSSFPGVGVLQPRGPIAEYYGQTSYLMERLGWSVYAAALSWRGTLAADGTALAAQIRAYTPSEPIAILAHSRGGLALRHALAELAASGELGRVSRVAGLGVPHWGSWDAQGALAGWSTLLRRYASVLEIVSRILYPWAVFHRILPVVQTWPALYELLPSPAAPGLPASVAALLYDPSAWQSIGISISATWLSAAQAAWAALPPSPATIPWLDVAGDGYSTPAYLIGDAIPVSPIELLPILQGDGTVPTAWSLQGGRPTWIGPWAHSQMPIYGPVLDAASAWLADGMLPARAK